MQTHVTRRANSVCPISTSGLMRYSLLLFFALSLLVLPATAQTLQTRTLPASTPATETDDPPVLHLTDVLMAQPATRRAVTEYKRLEAQGLLPARKAARTVALGDTATFKVRRRGASTCSMDDHEFRLMAESDRILIWAQLSELDANNISDDDVEGLRQAFMDSTPDGSFNADAGIIVNNELVFGEPTDVDGDGRTDMLLLDIQDGYDPSVGGGYVAGYIDGCDLSQAGNNADVLYLDTFPGLVTSRGLDGVAETAAHEYQHLIHLAYDIDELTFVNEGLSEWAEILNGYPGRPITYLNETADYNVNLLRWSGNASPNVFADYQRGGLFSTYLSERLGIMETGNITRRATRGAAGYSQAINLADPSLSLADVLADFHIANFLNDISVDPRFGYIDARRTDVRAVPGSRVDGRTTGETPQSGVTISPGAAEYLVWDQVRDFSLTINSATPLPLRPSLLLTQNGQLEIRDLSFSDSPQFFQGVYDRIAVVIPHTLPDAPNKVTVDYSASWSNEQVFTNEEQVFDDGNLRSGFPVFTVGADALQATRFVTPENSILSRVNIGAYFAEIFDDNLVSEPNDLILKVWADDGNGLPGQELFSLDVSNAVSNSTTRYTLTEIDLAAHRDALTNLPNPVYIGMTNLGSDANHLFMTLSNSNQTENTSFLIIPSSANLNEWTPIWDLSFTDNDTGERVSLQGTTLPIRANFLVSDMPVSSEDAAETPQHIILSPSFPNPFTMATAIRYTLPQTADVTLRVYDVLGREMATLVDGVQPGGEHQVTVDGSAWASGLYFYTLEADGQRKTQRMVLLR